MSHHLPCLTCGGDHPTKYHKPGISGPEMKQLTLLLKCDSCGVVVHESLQSRSESDKCGIIYLSDPDRLGYSPEIYPHQFYQCQGRLIPLRPRLGSENDD